MSNHFDIHEFIVARHTRSYRRSGLTAGCTATTGQPNQAMVARTTVKHIQTELNQDGSGLQSVAFPLWCTRFRSHLPILLYYYNNTMSHSSLPVHPSLLPLSKNSTHLSKHFRIVTPVVLVCSFKLYHCGLKPIIWFGSEVVGCISPSQRANPLHLLCAPALVCFPHVRRWFDLGDEFECSVRHTNYPDDRTWHYTDPSV